MQHELFGIESDSRREKLPTLSQFVKRTRKSKPLICQKVELIWLPGKFDNFTLQTATYRVIISPRNPLYDALKSFTHGGNETAEQGISVEITHWEDAKYVLRPNTESGAWSDIGGSGQRWIAG